MAYSHLSIKMEQSYQQYPQATPTQPTRYINYQPASYPYPQSQAYPQPQGSRFLREELPAEWRNTYIAKEHEPFKPQFLAATMVKSEVGNPVILPK
jgi:hypothetical protein